MDTNFFSNFVGEEKWKCTIQKVPSFAHAGVHIINNDFNVAIVNDNSYDIDYLTLQNTTPEKLLQVLDEYERKNNVKFVNIILSQEDPKEVHRLGADMWLNLDIIGSVEQANGENPKEIARKYAELAKEKSEKTENKIRIAKVDLTETRKVKVARLVTLEDYKGTTPNHDWHKLTKLTYDFKGKTIAFFNSTPQGGGVALMRHALMRLFDLLKIDAHWHVMKSDSYIFNITKNKMHNVFQGVSEEKLTEEDKEKLDQWSKANVEVFKGVIKEADVLVFDDYQTAGMIPHAKKINPKVKIIYRSHIQLRSELIAKDNTPQNYNWNFIWNKIKDYVDVFVSHPIREFVPHNVAKEKVVFMPATTDLLDGLNKPLTEKQVEHYLVLFNQLLNDNNQTPLDLSRKYIIQIARFDPSKGISDVLESYRLLRKYLKHKEIPQKDTPQLVICGHASVDDPEGEAIKSKALQLLQSTEYEAIAKDVKVLQLPSTDRILNALLRGSYLALQLSTSEGFEIKVSEALAKGKPVIAYNTGGIPLQIQDSVNGHLVEIGDTKEVARLMDLLIEDKVLYKQMSKSAKEHVRKDVWTVSNAINWLYLAIELCTKGKIEGNFVPVRELAGL